MKTIFTLRACLFLAFIWGFSVQGHAQDFSAGNIVVSKVGDGTTTIVSAGVSLPVQLVEFDPYATTPVALKTVALNNGAGTKLTLGTFRGEGQLKLSQDGRYITLLGYDSTPGATTAVHRASKNTVGRIGFDGSVNYNSYTPSSTTGSTRSAVSIDGSTVFTKTTTAFNAYNVDTSTSVNTAVAIFGVAGIRTLELFNNILFTGNANPYALTYSSTVTPTSTTGVTSTTLPVDFAGIAGTPNLCGFVFLDSDNNVGTGWNSTGLDLLYLADQSGGIVKLYFDGTNFKYVSTYFTANAGSSVASNITGRINTAGKVELFYTTGVGEASNNGLVMLIDSNAKNLVINPTAKVLALAGGNYGFRGVAFAPRRTKTWTGTTSTDYNTGSNWSDSAIPAITDFIDIPTGLSNYPVISANTTIAAGTIAAGASLTVNEGIVLNITSSITNNGDVILKSSASGTASLLSPTTVANVTQQRYLSSNQRGWRLLSNPVSTKSFNTLATASTISLGTNYTGQYQSATNTWTSTDGTANMAAQQAYKVFITGLTGEAPTYVNGPTNVTLVNKGTANNTVPAAIVTTLGEYYLIANPYTAPVSMSSIIGASTGLSNTVSYYNPTNGSTDVKVKFGGYNFPTASGAAGSATDVVIPPMGAIFVQATSAGTINIPKSAIFTGTPLQAGTYTYKTAQAKVSSTNALKVEVSSGGTYYDTVALQFKAIGDTDSNIDFGKLPNSILDAYSLKGGQKMAVAELELKEQTIPLGITSTILKNYTFKVAENTIPAGYEAVLVDNVLNSSTVLTPGTNYNFAIDNNPASLGDSRFTINLKTSGSLSLVDAALDSKIQLWPNPAHSEFNILNAQNQNDGVSTIEISTVNGQVIHIQKSNPGTTTTIQTNNWAKGIYILKATNNGTQTTKKLIIQ